MAKPRPIAFTNETHREAVCAPGRPLFVAPFVGVELAVRAVRLKPF